MVTLNYNSICAFTNRLKAPLAAVTDEDKVKDANDDDGGGNDIHIFSYVLKSSFNSSQDLNVPIYRLLPAFVLKHLCMTAL